MNIFNPKKAKEEMERKLEESYIKGKKDAENEFLSKSAKINGDEENWKKLSEKEITLEILKSLNLHNKRLDLVNDKISYIYDYKLVFKEFNRILKDISDKENILLENIQKGQEQITDFKSNVAHIKSSVIEIDKTLTQVINEKDNINDINKTLKNIIPSLKENCNQINDIADTLEETISKYKSSPIELLNNLNNKIGDKEEWQDYSEENLYKMIDEIRDEIRDNSIINKLEEIKNDIDLRLGSALDEYGYNSLYSKLDEIKNEISSINYN